MDVLLSTKAARIILIMLNAASLASSHTRPLFSPRPYPAQVYAGHEIGLVTEFVTVSQVADIITDVYSESESGATSTQARVVEREEVEAEKWIEAQDTYMKDFGQMFKYMAHSEAVQQRRSIAQTLQLVPNAQPLKEWIKKNKDDPEFREKLGLR